MNWTESVLHSGFADPHPDDLVGLRGAGSYFGNDAVALVILLRADSTSVQLREGQGDLPGLAAVELLASAAKRICFLAICHVPLPCTRQGCGGRQRRFRG